VGVVTITTTTISNSNAVKKVVVARVMSHHTLLVTKYHWVTYKPL
jgi:hypothetical protein